jgi:hypothetical protein
MLDLLSQSKPYIVYSRRYLCTAGCTNGTTDCTNRTGIRTTRYSWLSTVSQVGYRCVRVVACFKLFSGTMQLNCNVKRTTAKASKVRFTIKSFCHQQNHQSRSDKLLYCLIPSTPCVVTPGYRGYKPLCRLMSSCTYMYHRLGTLRMRLATYGVQQSS